MSDSNNVFRCAQWARSEEVDPVGSSGSYAAYLLVEIPQPWAADVGEMAPFRTLLPTLSAKHCRPQALVPNSGSSELRRIILYERDAADSFARYVGRESAVPIGEVHDCAEAMLHDTTVGSAIETDIVDLLMCTHGKRDVCCGSMGTRLVKELEERMDKHGPVRIWRTSHTGGHRFAPTMIVLPEGTAWAYLDAAMVFEIVDHGAPPSTVLNHYRGCSGLDSPRVQAAERSVLGEVGWELLMRPRWGVEVGSDAVRFSVQFPDHVAEWEATVTVRRLLPAPKCGVPLEAAGKMNPEYTVSELRSLGQRTLQP